MSKRWKVVGINFDHFHMGDLLRMAHEHPDVELAGISDEQPERMDGARTTFGLTDDQVFTDYRLCLEKTRPDLVILCPAAAAHGEWTRRVAEFNVNMVVEKPFAASLAEADAMVAAVAPTGKMLAINWPLRWFSCYVQMKKLIDDGLIGTVTNVYHYGGNRGPLFHGADKTEKIPTTEEKAASWFYSRKLGGGSLLDYLGYGTTIGTWFHNGRKPIEVTCTVDQPPGLEVDEHSIAVARYDVGLSKFETRWGTFTDPWTHQPQPTCGFVVCGTKGTLSAPDYSEIVRVQTHEKPEGYEIGAEELRAPERNPVEYLLHCIETGEKVTGPLSIEISRIGQQIVDSAALSAREKRTVAAGGAISAGPMGETTYGLGAQVHGAAIAAPPLPYQPPQPRNRDTPIALIGCGGISQLHLRAYAAAGLNVVAVASRDLERADARRAEFFPKAAVTADYREVLARPDVQIVDITTNSDVRPPLIEAALLAGKHVLSQKPFVLDLAEGERLVRLAESRGLQLAVNQNGRWAPHFAYMLAAVKAGLIGDLSSVAFAVEWDHHWVLGSPFEDVRHLILEDFGIHWFDMAVAFFGSAEPRSVSAVEARSRSQRARPPFLAHAIVEWDNGQATLQFNADCTIGQEDRTSLVGSTGTIRSIGPSLTEQAVTLSLKEGTAFPQLTGNWFVEGFQGTMLELLCAVEEKRAPSHSARENLRSLKLCFAAVESAETGAPVRL